MAFYWYLWVCGSSKKTRNLVLDKALHLTVSLPWLCAGDFNEILWSHEKLGLGPRQEVCMKSFRDTIVECGLKYLGYR